MIKNSKQVLVLVITALILVFSAFPLMVYADSDMTLNVEVFDANGNKYDSGKMPEIHFVIRDENGNEVTAITTNNKGTLDNTSLKLEEYKPYYLDLSDDMLKRGYFFYFDNEEENVWSGSLFKSAYDANQKAGTPGLQFIAANGASIQKMLSDTIKGAEVIRIVELTTPITITKAQLNNVDIKIADAEFSLYKYTGNESIFSQECTLKDNKIYIGTTSIPTSDYTLIKSFKTDANGIYEGIDIPFGNYLLFETKTPSGYFSTKSGNSIPAIPFGIREWNEKGENITIYNEKKCTATLQKVDENDRPLKGMKFNLQRAYIADGTIAYQDYETELITDADGIIKVEDLPYGTYRFVEQVKKGWRQTNPISFTVDGSSEEKTNATVKFINKPIKLTAYKFDSSTKAPVANAKFSLYLIENEKRILIDEYISDKNGLIFDLTQIKAGNYVIVETSAPGGYVLDNATCDNGTITVSGNEIFLTISDDADAEDLTVNIYNRAPEAQELSIKKTGKIIVSANSTFDKATGLYVYTFNTAEGLLEGATFTLTAKEDIYCGNELIYKSGAVVATITTDGKKAVSISDLYPGKYTLSETSAPAGYDKTYKDAEIVISDKSYTENISNTLKKVKFNIQKTDSTSNLPVENAIFGIFTKEDIYSQDTLLIKKDSCIAVLITDKNGTATTGDIYAPIGDYYAKELYAPDGYHLNTNTITQSYDGKVLEISFKFTNERQLGNIIITKKGDVLDYTALEEGTITWNEGPLSGVEFTLYAKEDIVAPDVSQTVIYKAGEKVDSALTDNYGIVRFDNLPIGKYTISETKTLPGYIQDGVPERDVIVSSTADAEETFYNKRRTTTVIVDKTDGNNTPVLNAIFGIYNDEDITDKDGTVIVPAETLLSTFETDKTGLALLSEAKLPVGHYTVKEVSAPNGYYKSDKTFAVNALDGTLANNGSYYYTFNAVNIPYELVIQKVDKTDGTNIIGATLSLYKEGDDAPYKTWITDGNDMIIKPIPVGNYVLKETNTPTGYQTAKDINFSINEGKLRTTIQMEDERPSGAIIIQKYKDGSSTPIANVTFALKDSDGNILDKQITNENGVAIFSNVAIGEYANGKFIAPFTYNLEEIRTPAGYIKAPDTTITIDINGKVKNGVITETRTVYNDYTKLKVIKVDADTGKEITGAHFALYNEYKKLVVEWNDDETSVYETSALAPGKYKLVETKTPNGYIASSDGIDIEITETSDIKEVIVKNKFDDYDITVSKTDQDGKPIPDVKLELRDSDDKVIDAWTSTNEPHSIKGLVPGTYTIVEIETRPGYIASAPQTFVLEEGGITTKLHFDVVNAYTTVKINKLDSNDNKFLSNAKLHLENKSGEIIAQWTTGNEAKVLTSIPVGTYKLVEDEAPEGYLKSEPMTVVIQPTKEVQEFTLFNDYTKLEVAKLDAVSGQPLKGAKLHLEDENGTVIKKWKTTGETYKINYLIPGTYTLVEDEAPEGYLKSEPITFELKATNEVQTIQMYDKYTRLEITKVDKISGKPLEGAKFYLKDKDGTNVAKWTSSEEAYVIEKLAPGIYTLVEHEAPKGYIITKTIEFELEATSELQVVTVENDYTKLEITKTDKISGKPLEGAKLHLEDWNGNVVARWISTKSVYVINKLEPGKYTLIEDEAPQGYIKSNPITFVVEATGEVQSTTLSNDYTKVVIRKVEAGTKQPVVNVRLHLEDKEGNIVAVWTTTKDGYTINHLTPGEYLLVEDAAPEGYIIARPMVIEIKETNKVQNFVIENNYTKLKITKVDAITDRPLENARLHLEDLKGNVIAKWTSSENPYLIEKLAPGKYVLVEDEAPEGYLKSEPITFELKSTSDTQTIVMKDDYTKVLINKFEKGTDKYVIGAKLHLEDLNGNVIAEWITSNTAFAIDHLLTGEYVIVEDEAPAGYTVAEPVKITVLATGEVQTFTMENDYTKVQIFKYKDGTEEFVIGAKMHLEDAEGNIIATWETSENAFCIDRLLIGKYKIVEDEAPNGFDVADPIEIVITSTNAVQEFVMYDKVKETPEPEPSTPDEPEKPEEPEEPTKPSTPDTPATPDTPSTPDTPNSPQTGDTTNTMFYFGLMILSLIAIAIFSIKKNKLEP